MAENSRWYTQDGQLAPDALPYADKKRAGEFRKPTLADAKKQGWVRSVSTFLDAVAKHGLQAYYDDQLLEAVRRHPLSSLFVAGEMTPEERKSYKDELMVLRDEHRDQASEMGTQVHAWIQRGIEGKELPVLPPELMVTADAMTHACPVHLTGAKTEATFVRLDLEYAGTPDIVSDGCIVDWKTQGKLAKKMEQRDSWAMQLAAYSMGVFGRVCTAYIVCGSTVEPGGVRVWEYSPADIQHAWERFDLIRRYVLLTSGSTINNKAAVAA